MKAVTTVAIATAPAKALATEVIATASMASTASVCVSHDTYSKFQQTFNYSSEIHVLLKETETHVIDK